MLDVMRKHSSSWLIKVIFALIILSFVLFFGYSRMQKAMKGLGGKSGIAVMVNGERIPVGYYKLAYENTHEFYKQLFPEQIPEDMVEQMKAAALHQIINRTLLTQLAGEFNISVTPDELYESVSKNPNFQRDGVFDADAYKNNFLVYFERRYGLNYEDFLKNDLLAEKVRNFLEGQINVTETEARGAFDRENRLWGFERITIPVTAPEGITYDIDAEEIAKKTVEAKVLKSSKELDDLLKKYKLGKDKVEKVSILNTEKLLPSQEDENAIKEILSLDLTNPTLGRPVKSGSNWYIITLTDLVQPNEEKWNKEKETFISSLTSKKKQEYLMQWLESFKSKSDIKEYVLGMR